MAIKYFGEIDEPVFTGFVFQQIRLSSIVAIVYKNVYRDFLSPAPFLLLLYNKTFIETAVQDDYNGSKLINVTWKGDIEE